MVNKIAAFGFIVVGFIAIILAVGIFTGSLNSKTSSLKLYGGILTGASALLLTLIGWIFDTTSSKKSDTILANTETTKNEVTVINEKSDTSLYKLSDLQKKNINLQDKVIELQNDQIAKNQEILALGEKLKISSGENLDAIKENISLSKIIKNPLPNEIKISFTIKVELEKTYEEKVVQILKQKHPNLFAIDGNNILTVVDYKIYNDLNSQDNSCNLPFVIYFDTVNIKNDQVHYDFNSPCYSNLELISENDFKGEVKTLFCPRNNQFFFGFKDIRLFLRKGDFSNQLFRDVEKLSIYDLEKKSLIFYFPSIKNIIKIDPAIDNFRISSNELNLSFRQLSKRSKENVFVGDIIMRANKTNLPNPTKS